MTVIHNSPSIVFEFSHRNIKNNIPFVISLFNEGYASSIWKHLTQELKENKEIVEASIVNGYIEASDFANEEVSSNCEIMIKAIEKEVFSFEKAHENLKKPPHFLAQVIETILKKISLLNSEINNYRQLCFDGFYKNYAQYLERIIAGELDNTYFLLALTQRDGMILEFIPKETPHYKEIAQAAIKQDNLADLR